MAVTNPQDRTRIGETMKRLLQLADISTQTAADAIGKSPQQMYQRLNGKCDIAAHELVILAELMDIEPAAFFRDPDDLLRRATTWIYSTAALAS